ncbi:MAG: GDP-mannose 4,6-dehydratase [Candidatus Omnitrophica bacterium]|nr:GDP-mannose 4,6-dehydratase [Candidatus Omnitrophota bacterium]
MNILVTGGAGFIGSYLTESLIREGNSVTVIDDLSTGKHDNLSALNNNKNFRFFEGSILDYKLMLKLVTECDVIYHLAAAVGVKFIVENPLQSLITNVRGTEIVLELAHIFKKKVFIASSSEVYGKNGKDPFKETDDRILGSAMIPRWGYAFSKGFDEFLAIGYYRSTSLPVVIGRLFNICGPRQSSSYGMVIPRFIQQALNNEPMTVYGDGTQVRSFTFIGDTIEAIKALMNNPKAEGGIFNIGSTESVRIIDLAVKIKELSASTSEIVFIPYIQAYGKNSEDMFYRIPDISKINELLGFTPQIKLEEMLKIIINECRSR